MEAKSQFPAENVFTENGKTDFGKPAHRILPQAETKSEAQNTPPSNFSVLSETTPSFQDPQPPKTFNYSLDILGRAKEKFLMAAAKWFNPETRPNIHTAKEHKGLRLLLDKICQLKSLPQPETETESVVGHLETFLGKCQYVLAEDLEFRSNFMPAWIGEHFDELCQKLIDWNKNNTPEQDISNQASLQKKVKLADGTIEISPVSMAEELAYRRKQYASHHTHSNNGEVERGMAAHRLLSKIHPDEFIQNLPDEAGDWQAVLV